MNSKILIGLMLVSMLLLTGCNKTQYETEIIIISEHYEKVYDDMVEGECVARWFTSYDKTTNEPDYAVCKRSLDTFDHPDYNLYGFDSIDLCVLQKVKAEAEYNDDTVNEGFITNPSYFYEQCKANTEGDN